MELKRRYIFHGDAVAIGGRVVRPKDVWFDPECGSTQPTTGGRTSAAVKGRRFDKFLRFGSATSLAEGAFDDRKKQQQVTKGIGRHEDLSTTTTVRAAVTDLVVGVKPQLVIKRLRVSLISKSPEKPDGETIIGMGKDAAIDGVAIGGHKLVIELNKTLFRENDTFTKLKRAAQDATYMQNHAACLVVGATIDGKPQSGLIEVRGTCYGTIVQSIRWAGKPYPDAVIDGHVVTVPEFGKIYFGEILISRDARRITLLRCEFGSPFGGDMGAADVQDNGSWYP
jgi:hypothetical protein